MRKLAVAVILTTSFLAAGAASAQSRADGMTNMVGPYQSLDESWRARHDEMRERMAAKRKASPAVIAAKAKADAKAAKLAQLETRAGS